MPRYRGVGMPRKRKTVKEPPSEAVDIPPERPDASEPAAPPSPDPKLTIRARPPQSPGMKAVKAAAFQARKADRIAKKAYVTFLQEKLTFTQCYIALTNRGERLGKDRGRRRAVQGSHTTSRRSTTFAWTSRRSVYASYRPSWLHLSWLLTLGSLR